MGNKKNKRIAFLMPIIPPHFHQYAKVFLKSFEFFKLNKQADFYFVFSNKDDEKVREALRKAVSFINNNQDDASGSRH